MAKQETSSQKDETKECLNTVKKRFNAYFIKQGIDQWDPEYLKEVGKAVGIAASTVRACFNGERLTTRNLMLLADYLHISTDYLLGLADDTSSFKTYSDVFFYLKYLIDNGALVPTSYYIDSEVQGPGYISPQMIDGSEEIPTTHIESVPIATFRLQGKFADLIMQYYKIAQITHADWELLESWRNINLARIDGPSKIQKTVDFESKFKVVQDSRKITNTELKKQLNLSATYMISRYRGGAFPVPKIITKMAKYLNVSSDYLLGLSSNYDRSVSERDLLKLLIILCHQCFLVYYQHPDHPEDEFLRLDNPIFEQFCSIYQRRHDACSPAECVDFMKEIGSRFAYNIIPLNDMPEFAKITLPHPSEEGYYMQDYSEKLKKYYNLHPDKRTTEKSEEKKKQGTK